MLIRCTTLLSLSFLFLLFFFLVTEAMGWILGCGRTALREVPLRVYDWYIGWNDVADSHSVCTGVILTNLGSLLYVYVV